MADMDPARLTWEQKGKAKIEENQSGRTPRHPVAPTRLTTNEKGKRKIEDDTKRRVCFSMVLSTFDVFPANGKPRLFLNEMDVRSLFEGPSTEMIYGKFGENLAVFDLGDRQYDMFLSYSVTDACFIVDAGWQRFVKIHTLTEDDQIFFYRISNEGVHDKPYYEVQYMRNSPRLMGVSGGDKNYLPGQNRALELRYPTKPGPGSRFLPESTVCLSKYLGETDVSGENPMLLNECDAGFLIGCGNMKEKYRGSILNENLLVYDKDDRQYDMLLSECTSYPLEANYCIDAGWQRFVHIHNLKIDDVIIFHRLIDNAVNDEPYYVVRYIRKEIPDGSEATGETPSSCGEFFEKLVDTLNKRRSRDLYKAGPSGNNEHRTLAVAGKAKVEKSQDDYCKALLNYGTADYGWFRVGRALYARSNSRKKVDYGLANYTKPNYDRANYLRANYGRSNPHINIISRLMNPKLHIRPGSLSESWETIMEHVDNLIRYSERPSRAEEEAQARIMIKYMRPGETIEATENRLKWHAQRTRNRRFIDEFQTAFLALIVARRYEHKFEWTREELEALLVEPRY